jgi:hypothetical protein
MDTRDDAFPVDCPCWLLLRLESVASTGDDEAQRTAWPVYLRVRDAAGKWSLPVFTDGGAANAFIKASDGLEDVAVISAETTDTLLDILDMMKGAAKAVVLNPQKAEGWSAREWPIGDVIKQVQRSRGLK